MMWLDICVISWKVKNVCCWFPMNLRLTGNIYFSFAFFLVSQFPKLDKGSTFETFFIWPIIQYNQLQTFGLKVNFRLNAVGERESSNICKIIVFCVWSIFKNKNIHKKAWKWVDKKVEPQNVNSLVQMF